MRTSTILTAVALVASTLTAGLIGSAGPASAAPNTFKERWCDGGAPAPCLESVTINGFTLTSASPEFDVLMTGTLDNDGNRYFQWLVQDLDGPSILSSADAWKLTFDTGSLDPRYTEGYSGVPETQRIDDGDGTFKIVYTARPVLTAFACEPDGGWPTTCPKVAEDDETTGSPADDRVQMMLYGEVQDKAGDEDLRGFDVAQNVDEVSGPFLETAPDGSQYLESFMANSHQFDNNPGPAVAPVDFKGQVRWRLPYRMLRNWFGIPNPELMVPASLVGTVRRPDGTASTATFDFTHDPAGEAWTVDVTDIGFSRKVLRVRTGKITPTPPGVLRVYRTAPRAGSLSYTASEPRGARVTGYKGRCVAVMATDHVVTSSADRTQTRISFTGLRRGVAYDCGVRATSKAGPGRWSVERVPAQVVLPE